MGNDLITPRSVSFSFNTRLTPEAVEFYKAFFAQLPAACPSCGWTRPSETWKLVNDSYICMKCGSDVDWPEYIGYFAE